MSGARACSRRTLCCNSHGLLPPLHSLATAAIALAIAACTVTPTPLTETEVKSRVAADQKSLFAGQEPVEHEITFHEAVARALKYNLDYRLKLMETALAQGLFDVSRYDMLPKLVASAGYNTRSNDSGGTSVSIIDGRETLSPSTSQERNRWLANAEFSWNVLDFGVSYYRAHQAADEALIAEERRRRVAQNILQDVRGAYWRALGAQRLAGEAEELLVRVRSALEKSRLAEKAGLLPPPQALAYQRALLDATTLINIRRQEIEFAKSELAALMNLAPGTPFRLADEPEMNLPRTPRDPRELEETALRNRPELREEDYRRRISVAETHRALLSLMPGLTLDLAGRYDSNQYLYNQSWTEGGIQVFSNLMRLLAYPSIEKSNEARLKVDDARRLALSMAVITQVRVAIERYNLALADFENADDASKVDQRLLNYAKAAASTRVDTELEVVRTEARALIARFQRYASYANAQVAYGRIYNSLGRDVLPDRIEKDDVASLARAVAAQIQEWEQETFVDKVEEPRPRPVLRVEIVNIPDPRLASEASAAVEGALPRYAYVVDPGNPEAWTLRMRLDYAKAPDAIRRGVWQISFIRPDGSIAGSSRYVSAIGSRLTPSALSAFSEAATVAQLWSINVWSGGNSLAGRPGPEAK
ncbi:MAG: TolC family protein [Betaproteobacteria bacterium]|nr:MAG: TolC family protein [Betaproteobacteria bacterium]